jgi:hypothetical protein
VIGGLAGQTSRLAGSWYSPGLRMDVVLEDAQLDPDVTRWRLESPAPDHFRVFMESAMPLEGHLVAADRLEWANGVASYRDSPLTGAEARIHSQNGEDGVLLAILEAMGIARATALEFGVQDGSECNTRVLAERGGTIIQWDCDHHEPSRGVYRELVTIGNLPELVARYDVPHDLDVLSIDVDYYDFYLWWRMSEIRSPRLVIIEYNGAHGVDDDCVVLYEGVDKRWDGTRYFGASLAALVRLGAKLGYVLVHAESAGINAFFVRRSDVVLLGGLAPHAGDLSRLYRGARYGCGGHAADPLRRAYTSSAALLSAPTVLEAI